MADLRVNLFGKQLAGPVIAASGTFGFGPEYAGIEDLRVLGGISGKGLTLNGQPGNDGERLLETPSGLMNSIGLQNPGVQHFIENELPAMKTCGTSVWVNLGGHTIEENVEGVQKLCAAGIDVLELNISCPNVKQGGLAFGIRAKDAEEVVSAVRKVCTVPLVSSSAPRQRASPICARPWKLPVPMASACAIPSRPAPLIWKSAARCSTTPLPGFPARPSAPLHCAWCGRLWGPSISRSSGWAAS